MRSVFGKPGSLTRWIIGSVIWLAVCFALFLWTFNFFLLLFAVLIDIAAFVARGILVGDEDELNASLDQSLVHAIREGVPPSEVSELDPDSWFVRGSRRFDDVPPPPIAEDPAGCGSGSGPDDA